MIMPIRSSIFAIAVCWFAAFAHADDHAESSALQLAEAYGLSGWSQIAQIEYTFNVELPNRDEPIARRWIWSPGQREVWRITGGDSNGTPIDLDAVSEADQEIHQQFINDSYWLLFPFQLVWSNPAVTSEGVQPLPLGEGAGQKFITQWPTEGGYTPGDAYDLYLGEDGLIQQWVFRRGGQPEGNAHTWEDHQQLGPIIVSLDHHGPEGSGFRLWFTEVKATLTDGTVVTPQPIAEP